MKNADWAERLGESVRLEFALDGYNAPACHTCQRCKFFGYGVFWKYSTRHYICDKCADEVLA